MNFKPDLGCARLFFWIISLSLYSPSPISGESIPLACLCEFVTTWFSVHKTRITCQAFNGTFVKIWFLFNISKCVPRVLQFHSSLRYNIVVVFLFSMILDQSVASISRCVCLILSWLKNGPNSRKHLCILYCTSSNNNYCRKSKTGFSRQSQTKFWIEFSSEKLENSRREFEIARVVWKTSPTSQCYYTEMHLSATDFLSRIRPSSLFQITRFQFSIRRDFTRDIFPYVFFLFFIPRVILLR